MKQQLVLTPKDSVHPKNCMITAVKHSEDEYCVEIYNVFGDYHKSKPMQCDIPSDSKWHKYKNKRYMMSEEEFKNKYIIINRLCQ